MTITLGDIRAAHARIEKVIAAQLEDALEFSNQAKFDAYLRDETICNAAFFALIFGQLEARLNELAVQRLSEPRQRSGIRGASFEKRLAMAVDDPQERKAITEWYQLRNRISHGHLPLRGFNMNPLLEKAFEMDKSLMASTPRT